MAPREKNCSHRKFNFREEIDNSAKKEFKAKVIK
jgi:hypothetical protein